jgi:hypothetical protein
MKYQLADTINGNFGEVFNNLTDAENALILAIEEGQKENDLYSEDYRDQGLPVPQAEDFLFIVEI